MNSFLFAVHDIRESFSHTQLWLWTGLQDIKLRYRRSALGPWWLTISTGILVAAMGILYAGIFKHTISDYLPNFAVSYIFWIFFSGQINESATAFTQFENILKQTRIPLLSCVLRILTRHVIILLHNALIILIAFMIFGFKFSLNLIYFLPAFFIFLLFYCQYPLPLVFYAHGIETWYSSSLPCSRSSSFYRPFSGRPRYWNMAPNPLLLGLIRFFI